MWSNWGMFTFFDQKVIKETTLINLLSGETSGNCFARTTEHWSCFKCINVIANCKHHTAGYCITSVYVPPPILLSIQWGWILLNHHSWMHILLQTPWMGHYIKLSLVICIPVSVVNVLYAAGCRHRQGALMCCCISGLIAMSRSPLDCELGHFSLIASHPQPTTSALWEKQVWEMVFMILLRGKLTPS